MTKLHEQKLIPSLQALILQANYVIKLALSSSLITSPFLQCFEQFGWHKTGDGTIWDRDVTVSADSSSSSGEESEDSDTDSSDEPENTVDIDSDCSF